ncbi:MAG: site-specific integrase [Chloroflexi bacterium]|nr:site-specific integrase [Chloroflexota bacterium]
MADKALSTVRAERVHKYVEASKAEGTRRMYESHWRDFTEYCHANGFKSLPAEIGAVADYLTYLADLGAKNSTIQGKAAAISFMHRMAKLPNPVRTVEIQELLRGIRRTLGIAQKGKEPITLEQLKSLLDQLPEGIRGTRDKAMLLVGFGGAFRRSELVDIKLSDITFNKTDAIVVLRRSKTDQEGLGMRKLLPVLKDKTICPVTALQAWIREAGITEGVVFRPIGRRGNVITRGMNSQEVARLVKKYTKAAGLDVDLFSGHSLRAGYVTEAAKRDVSIWKIKQQTGHKSDQVLQRYIRDKQRGAASATRSAFGEE